MDKETDQVPYRKVKSWLQDQFQQSDKVNSRIIKLANLINTLTFDKVGHIFDLWNIVIPDVTFFAEIRKDLIEFFACLGWVVFLQVGNNDFPCFNFFRCVFHGWDGFVTKKETIKISSM